jgi:hypothetical protein
MKQSIPASADEFTSGSLNGYAGAATAPPRPCLHIIRFG